MFGSKCDPNKNASASDVMNLSVDRLRRASRNALLEEGYKLHGYATTGGQAGTVASAATGAVSGGGQASGQTGGSA